MDTDLKKTIDTLSKGQVILYPTDTVWGIGCDATNPEAVNKIFTIKRRNESKSLIVLVDSDEMLKHYVNEIPGFMLDFLKNTDNPTTIIYPFPKNLAKNVISFDNTVAIRIVKDDFCKKVIHLFQKPIVSTSANISGEPTPRFFKEIDEKIIESCDYVVQHRQDDDAIRQPSRLVRFDSERNIFFLR